jgi:hypothetical protein
MREDHLGAPLRDYAEAPGVSEAYALQKNMQKKSVEFVKKGGELNQRA